jgi:hypothetical protein
MEHIPRGEAREKEGAYKRRVPPKRDWQRGRSSEGVLGPSNGVLKKTLLAGCSKTLRYKALEILRNETYIPLRRSDEG